MFFNCFFSMASNSLCGLDVGDRSSSQFLDLTCISTDQSSIYMDTGSANQAYPKGSSSLDRGELSE
jgi:hypothetical protein